MDALSPLGQDNVVGGEGAIYLFAKLPEGAHVSLSYQCQECGLVVKSRNKSNVGGAAREPAACLASCLRLNAAGWLAMCVDSGLA